VLLWGYVDDHGKAKDNPLLVKADCFPLDEDITGDTIDGWLWVLEQSGVIVRYQVSGVNYLAIKNWAEHQKPQHPTADSFPGFTGENVLIRTVDGGFMQPSCDVHESLTPELSRVEYEIELEMRSRNDFREDVETLCNHLTDLMVGNGSKQPTVTEAWRREARLLLDKDQRSFDEAMSVLDWCQRDEFWKSNIESIPKFRKQYDRLRLRMESDGSGRVTNARKNLDTVAYFERQQLEVE
jgi:hypothetical protein